jgi:fructoselysine-6-P-deglycase FrlB-like protein
LSPGQNSIPGTLEYEVEAQTAEWRRLFKHKEETRKIIDKGIKKRKTLFSTKVLGLQKL